MKRSIIYFFILIRLALLATVADTRTWTGAVDTDWNNAGNWDGAVPAAGDAVLVPDTATKPFMTAGVYPATGSFLSFEAQPGAVVTCLGDVSAINSDSGGTVAVPHGIGVTINSQSALINGTLSADVRGFTYNAGGFSGPGYSSSYGAGGTYGGRGGYYMETLYSSTGTYGSLLQPTALGSAGYQDTGAGGGAVRLNVSGGVLTVNGVITANGTMRGSGGSIWLICDIFAGAGTIRSVGGGGANGANWGSGGGGRVAVEYGTSTFSGVISVAPGLTYDPPGVTGAVFSCQSPVLGIAVSNNVIPWLKSEFGVSSNDVQIARTVNVWRARALEWRDVSTDVSGSTPVANNTIYTLNGLQATSQYWVFDNGVNLFGDGTTNSSPEGTLSFNILLDEPRTVRVELMQSGTLFMAR